mgnify:CR=1 FL=1
MNIKILVATQKKYWMPEDKVYVPLHEGAENKTPLGYLPNNNGEKNTTKNQK